MVETKKDFSDGEGTLTPASYGDANASKGGTSTSVNSVFTGDDTRPVTRAASGYEEQQQDLEAHRTISHVHSLVQAVGQRPACFKNTLQEVSFVTQATIAMSTTTFLVGATSIVTASIGADLGMSQAEIVWIAAASTLTAGAFQLTVGQLADMLGRKVMYLAGMGSFAVFVLLLGFAQNPFWMDIVLGVLGISCAMVVPPAGGILGAAYEKPSKRKNMAFAAFSAGNPTGFVLGSITCGIATMLFSVCVFQKSSKIMNLNMLTFAQIIVEGNFLLHLDALGCLLPACSLGSTKC